MTGSVPVVPDTEADETDTERVEEMILELVNGPLALEVVPVTENVAGGILEGTIGVKMVDSETELGGFWPVGGVKVPTGLLVSSTRS